jgi:hypothetical protein
MVLVPVADYLLKFPVPVCEEGGSSGIIPGGISLSDRSPPCWSGLSGNYLSSWV